MLWSAYVVGVAWVPWCGVGAFSGVGALEWCLLDWWTYQRRCVNAGTFITLEPTSLSNDGFAVPEPAKRFKACDSAL